MAKSGTRVDDLRPVEAVLTSAKLHGEHILRAKLIGTSLYQMGLPNLAGLSGAARLPRRVSPGETQESRPVGRLSWNGVPAVSCSPARLPSQYHRR